MEISILYRLIRRSSTIVLLFLIASTRLVSQDAAEHKTPISQFVRPYEPINIGMTKDAGDQWFMDFSLSIMLPVAALIPKQADGLGTHFPNGRSKLHDPKFHGLYLAFNGRAAQYVGTRKSSPVVGKRFNPLLAYRRWNGGDVEKGMHDYFEFSYGHESNGQRLGDLSASGENIDWRARFESLIEELRGVDENPENVARDEISRGWDYLGARWSRAWQKDNESLKHFLLVDVKYYLSDGILQGKREDYYEWENEFELLDKFDGEILRNKVDGLTFSYRIKGNHSILNEVGVEVKTGYKEPFERITVKLEVEVFRRYALWYRHGYNSDFVNYYHKDNSFGVAFKIRQF